MRYKIVLKIPNHAHSIMSAAGVWQLKPEVCILNGPEARLERKGQDYNTVLFLNILQEI